MTHECIGIKQEVSDLNEAIKNIEELKIDTWNLKYYHSRLQERHDTLLTNNLNEIDVLKERIEELESKLDKNGIKESIEKINIIVKYNILAKRVTLDWNTISKKRDFVFDEYGRKWFIPKLNDDSYIKIKFIGKYLDDQEKLNENMCVHINGMSGSSTIIGNTIMGRGRFKDIKNGFIVDKRTLKLLLIDSSIWFVNRIYVCFYVLKKTESIEIIESSKDINATLEIV